jgi:hypothetical protein
MRKSKYIGLKIGDWICTHVGVDRVQPAYKLKRDALGKRVRNKYPGHMSYYYIFERLTHDGKAMKMIRLSAAQANYVLKGIKTVEDYAIQKEQLRSPEFIKKVSYSFCD